MACLGTACTGTVCHGVAWCGLVLFPAFSDDVNQQNNDNDDNDCGTHNFILPYPLKIEAPVSTQARFIIAMTSGLVLIFSFMVVIALSSTKNAYKYGEPADLAMIIGELRYQHDAIDAEVRETLDHAQDLTLVLSLTTDTEDEAELREQLAKSQSVEFRKLVHRRDTLAKLLADYESRFVAGLE